MDLRTLIIGAILTVVAYKGIGVISDIAKDLQKAKQSIERMR